ncbi:MAG: hypothetical protein DDG60_14030 [Anaerolineae bacterium]|nr:MAG: hypothetical protein DDG60_14030 [Anaerolineae bacterium]
MPARQPFLLAFFFTLCLFVLSSCLTAPLVTSTDPKPQEAYVFVTANPRASSTPFQPAPNTETPIPQPTVQPSPTATIPSTPTNPPSPSPWPSEIPASWNGKNPQYTISAQMDYANRTVTVSQVVTYPNQTGETLSTLVMAVNPNLWRGVFSLQNLTINHAPADYTLSGQWLTINLTPPLPATHTIEIGIAYQLNLPYSSTAHENFGYTWRQVNLIDWYPFVVPYMGNGAWILHAPHPYGENLVYPLADFHVRLTFSDANPPVVAASAPARYLNDAFVYELPNARNFTISASPYFLVQTAEANGITIYKYYFAEHAVAATHALELTRQAILTYQNLYGPYPHTALSVVETDLNDGLETDGLYFLAANFYETYDGTVRNNLSVITVHETAHQWWYGAVANDQALEPWLDEALCTYSERIFYEYNYPGALNWWWNFRIYSYNPTGYVDSHIYDSNTFRAYVNAVYFQGAKFLEALRSRIGDAAFLAFLQDYYTRHRERIATANDFFTTLSAHTAADYSDLLRSYFTYR